MTGKTILKSRWGILIGVGTFSAMILGAILAGAVQAPIVRILAGALLCGGVVGGILALLGVIDRRTRFLNDRVREGVIEARAMTNIRPLLREHPLNVDGWALPAETCERLVYEVTERRPRTIVECGSGTSTILMAAGLQSSEISGHIYSLDHDEAFAERTRQKLQLYGLDQFATVITAPLASMSIGSQSFRWYDFNPEDYIEHSVDFLFVDGPPWNVGSLSRYPAVPVLRDYLSSDCLIVLDDGDRPDEEQAAHAWAEELGYASPKLDGEWQPYWVLQPAHTA
jgi:predicted O-methyltransferase YrrM